MKLLINLVRKDFKRNPAITTALVVFLILAALLMAGGLRVAGTMISAYDQLNQKAIPPEYLQMHKGEYDNEAVSKLNNWYQANPFPPTLGLTTLLSHYNNQTYPGLGSVKKLSVMHHLELMGRYLSEGK
ncbi:MAG: hypothetical protein Q8O06_03755 [Acetobacterium sp.]|nr:hypothetical protein [Acetobacterium sp.]